MESQLTSHGPIYTKVKRKFTGLAGVDRKDQYSYNLLQANICLEEGSRGIPWRILVKQEALNNAIRNIENNLAKAQ